MKINTFKKQIEKINQQNIVDVYNAVRDLCNKDQRGFVTPEVFSTFAGIAQQNIFNEMFQELITANKDRNIQVHVWKFR